eukprot:gene936-3398_t
MLERAWPRTVSSRLAGSDRSSPDAQQQEVGPVPGPQQQGRCDDYKVDHNP